MRKIRTRTQMICAALGAVAVAATVALTGMLHQDPARSDDSEVVELLGGPPGFVAVPHEDPTATTTSTSASPTSVTTTTKAAPKPAPKPGGSTRPGGMPGPANTGPVPGAALTVVNGDQTFSGSGQVIEGKDFHGFVKVTGKNITFRNCIFRGRATTSNNALLDTESGSGTVVEDSEFVPSNPAPTIDSIAARNTTITRVHIHGGVDGMKAESNTIVQDSYIHDMNWFSSDPNQGGGATHNDGIQSFDGESNVIIRHNTIDMSTTKSPNAAWQTSAFNSRIENNFLDGGGCIINVNQMARSGGLAIVGNRFGRHSEFKCPILLSTRSKLSENSGNVWADTGEAIPEPQVHD